MKILFFTLSLTIILISSASAMVVGKNLSDSAAFKQYVDSKHSMIEKNDKLEQESRKLIGNIKILKNEINRNDNSFYSIVLTPMLSFLRTTNSNFKIIKYSALVSLFSFFIYIIYLYKYNKIKFRLFTHKKTLSRFKEKILRNNLIALFILILISIPNLARANTTTLEDMLMYCFGNDLEKDYLDCKYKNPYFEIKNKSSNGHPIFQKVTRNFEKSYNILTFLITNNKKYDANDFLNLYLKATNDVDQQAIFNLVPKASMDIAKEASELIISRLQGAIPIQIDQFKTLIISFDNKDTRILIKPLTEFFLNNVTNNVRDLDGLDRLVSLAAENDLINSIKESSLKVIENLPRKLSFQDAVYAAHISLTIESDHAKNIFASFRFLFNNFFTNDRTTVLLKEIIHTLSEKSSTPLYEQEELVKNLQLTNNDFRVHFVSFLDECAPSLALAGFKSISMNPGDLADLSGLHLKKLAQLTAKYKKDNTQELLSTVAKLISQRVVNFDKDNLLEAVRLLGSEPATFVEKIMLQEKNYDSNSVMNRSLMLNLIEDMTSQQINQYNWFFIQKQALATSLLPFLYKKEKNVFFSTLARSMELNTPGVHDILLENEAFDFQPISKAFTIESIKQMNNISASLILAHHELSKETINKNIVRKALIPHFNAFFKNFLGESKKTINEHTMLTILLLHELINSRSLQEFQKESNILQKLIEEYFSNTIESENTRNLTLLQKKEHLIQELINEKNVLEEQIHQVKSYTFYARIILILLIITFILSAIYAANAIIPGKEFNLLFFLIELFATYGIFLIVLILFLPLGFFLVLTTQFLRSLLLRDATVSTNRERLLVLDKGVTILDNYK